MGMKPMRYVVISVGMVSFLSCGTGCSRQDSECLARIGRKLLTKTHDFTADLRDKADQGWRDLRGEPSLLERVEERLRWDKHLTGTDLQVSVQQKEVFLKGQAANEHAKKHAVDLAETTLGVERVHDEITLPPPPLEERKTEIPATDAAPKASATNDPN